MVTHIINADRLALSDIVSVGSQEDLLNSLKASVCTAWSGSTPYQTQSLMLQSICNEVADKKLAYEDLVSALALPSFTDATCK